MVYRWSLWCLQSSILSACKHFGTWASAAYSCRCGGKLRQRCTAQPHCPILALPCVLQYCYLLFCIVALLPLTLPIDGADWSGQFDGWTASSWAVLVMVAVTCVLANFCIQARDQHPASIAGVHLWHCALPAVQQHDHAMRVAWTLCDASTLPFLPLQHATWQLGAPTLSMFYGLRLVASIVLSELLLGYTVITSAVQVRGRARVQPRGLGGTEF